MSQLCVNITLSLTLFFFSSRRRHTRSTRDWSSDVCSSDLDPCDRLDADARSFGSHRLGQGRKGAVDVRVTQGHEGDPQPGVEDRKRSCRERVWMSVAGGVGYGKRVDDWRGGLIEGEGGEVE